MLSRQYRISLAKINPIGPTVKINQIVLTIVGVQPVNTSKFAVVIPSKYCRKAVARNRTRRLVWQVLALLKSKIVPAIYKIKICDDFSKLTLTEVLLKVEAVFAKAGVIK